MNKNAAETSVPLGLQCFLWACNAFTEMRIMHHDPAEQPTRGRLRLLVAVATIAVLWCVVLPWVGNTRYLKPMIEHNERWGIDPTALFYTDVETMTYRDNMLRRPND